MAIGWVAMRFNLKQILFLALTLFLIKITTGSFQQEQQQPTPPQTEFAQDF